MGGGLMQLVAYGAQDIYLTGNPQITFFKVVYRRHTNFSMEAIEQTWNGSEKGSNSRCTATISRNGDLVYRMYLDVLGEHAGGANNPGSSWIKNVTLEIGGQQIDKHTGIWLETWAELTQPNPYGVVVPTERTDVDTSGGGTLFQRMTGMGGVHGSTPGVNLQCFIPLQFWFCRNPGLALPLIALQYHEVKIVLEHDFGGNSWGTPTHQKLWCDYIYLDTDERRRFAQVSHEYLIEQVQEQSITASVANQELNFNHPVKELIWTNCTVASGDKNSTSLVPIVDAGDLNKKLQLKLNGHDRMAARPYTYFSRVQVWEHHSGPGGLASDTDTNFNNPPGGSSANDSIGVYSFALKPEEHQPSGTCNFSRIDNAQLVCTDGTFTTGNLVIFAVNYNVLRIMSGMGGLAYSN